ncbi:MAG: DUF547 domain-containing protein [Deltaproteobacteria bacterium]|nr:DUF547 domain-containing protein [Deltaproteobacteria bacterium]MCB9478907.1 DUF547 domain-containing protein [Deltaproteobacteria bacterium]MCB9489413.1 DUF547 domain-containing protein [Deltaproteobacteria bacterium]
MSARIRKAASFLFALVLLGSASTAFAFDQTHAKFDAILHKYVEGEGVDYARLAANSSELDAYLADLKALGVADYAKFSRDEMMALWINAYNAITLKSIAEKYPVKSIRDISGVWKKREWSVAGRSLTLDNIEHDILRDMGDPRIHSAINCASVGCPPLYHDAFTAEKLDAQLEAAAKNWARSDARNHFDAATKTAHISKIFDWFGGDFIEKYYIEGKFPELNKSQSAAVNFLYQHADDADRKVIEQGIEDVDYVKYDWSLNES